jgi:hypothetical protein
VVAYQQSLRDQHYPEIPLRFEPRPHLPRLPGPIIYSHVPAVVQKSSHTLYCRICFFSRGGFQGDVERISGWISDPFISVALTEIRRISP